MELSIIAIGNSKGIRLTKTILDKYKITDVIELIFEKDYIVLRPKSLPRKGWEKQFKKMHKNRHDSLIIEDVFKNENFEEWN